MGRAILLQIEHPDGLGAVGAEDAADGGLRCASPAPPEFDGVELVWPAGAPPEGREIGPVQAAPGGGKLALAARCGSGNLRAATAEVTALLSLAQRLGAGCLNLSISPGGAAHETGLKDTADFLYELLVATYFEAERAGVVLAVEAAAEGLHTSAGELRNVVDAVSSWAIGVCVDADRVTRYGPLAGWLETLRRRVFTLRLRRASIEAPDQASTPKAVASLGCLRTTLDEIDYHGLLICAGDGARKLGNALRRVVRTE